MQAEHGVPVTVIYGSDSSIVGYRDQEFDTSVAWEPGLLTGYTSIFMQRTREAGPDDSTQLNRPACGTKRLLNVVRKVQPSATLLVGYSPRFHQGAIMVALRSGVPILFRAETTDHDRGGRGSVVRDQMLRALYGRCSCLLYIGQRSRQHYERLGVPEARLTFSPYCVDDSVFRASEHDRLVYRERTRRDLGIEDSQKVILFSGKLVERKRPDLLLEALLRLNDQTPNHFVALFVGDGPLRSSLEERARSVGLPHRFVGFQDQRNLSQFFHAADVLVLPSEHGETWGLVVNEALAHGLPAVVSDAVGCAPDLITPGVNGAVFETANLKGLVASIGEMVTRRVDAKKARAACRKAVSRYSVAAAAAGIADAYARTTGIGAR